MIESFATQDAREYLSFLILAIGCPREPLLVFAA
jgi:hypothetical protein